MKIISRGAEAVLYNIGDKIKKERICKKYRAPQIDCSLRKMRTRKELNNMTRLRAIGVNVPIVSQIDDFSLRIERIKGLTLQELIKADDTNLKPIFKSIGEQIRQIHDFDIIHGDLAPTNIIINTDLEPFFIDFGLSYCSESIEDKATDFLLFLKLLESLNFGKNLSDALFEGYSPTQEFLKRLEVIKKRARYL